MTDQLSQPKLWWTWELGFPHLYKAVIEVWANGVLVDKKIQIFGIKEIKMDENWIFYLNGTRVFIRGNNYLSDQFLSLMTKESYQLDVQMMLDANMNTTRLFAHAEQEEFYQLCNEKGIMVFQDLPFQWGYESTGLFIKEQRMSPGVLYECCITIRPSFFGHATVNPAIMITISWIICCCAWLRNSTACAL